MAGIFDFLSGKKRKAVAKVNDRLRKISEDRRAASGAPRGPQRETEAEKTRKASERVRQSALGRYLYYGEVQNVTNSTCVKDFSYDFKTRSLHIRFLEKNGAPSMYGYGVRMGSISPKLATTFFTAKSKGKAVWDFLRLRGTKLGHQVDYALEMGPVGGRNWEATEQTAAAHGADVAEQSSGRGGYAHLERFESPHFARTSGRDARNR